MKNYLFSEFKSGPVQFVLCLMLCLSIGSCTVKGMVDDWSGKNPLSQGIINVRVHHINDTPAEAAEIESEAHPETCRKVAK